MNYLDLTLASVAENLALDEALLLEAEASGSGEILRFWEWPTPTVILGAGSRLTEDVNQLACQADRVAILRRSSGGGTVRYMIFDPKTRLIWFGTDVNTIGRAQVPPREITS